MPILQFQCKAGHITDKFYPTISAGEKVQAIYCSVCEGCAEKIFSTPLPAHLYGNPDGFHKPSPTKRFSNKTVSQRDGNTHSAG